jgi:hypothetical protein
VRWPIAAAEIASALDRCSAQKLEVKAPPESYSLAG